MKKVLWLLLVLALVVPGGLFAGSIDYLSNQSARWLLSPSRNASTDAADIVGYNPAGSVFLPKGLSLDLSMQTLFKFYHNDNTFIPGVGGASLFGTTAVGKDFSQDLPTPALPNLYVAYNFGRLGPGALALYLQGGVPAGGGDLEWDDGTAGTSFALNGLRAQLAGLYAATSGAQGALTDPLSSHSFEASSIYYGIGLGGAYSFLNDQLSLRFGGRLVIAQRGFSMEASYGPGYNLSGEFEYNAVGFTPIIGFDVRPVQVKGLTLAFRYEIETQLEFEYEQKSLAGSLAAAGSGLLTKSGIYDGKKFHQNLPHIIGLGAEYQLNDKLAFSVSGNIYLLSVAKLGEVYDASTGLKKTDLNEYFDVGCDIGIGATYRIIENLKIGGGINYTESGAKDKYFKDSGTLLNASANPLLDSIAFGLGATYGITKYGLDLTLSCLYSHYIPQDYSVTQYSTPPNPIVPVYTVDGTYKKDIFEIGIGVGYHY
jgi:long-chain fatty acid transport protein